MLFLHGAPATGKLTVAKAILATVSGRLFDNHVAIDFARTLFDFGAPGFWELVHEVRLAAIDAAARNGVTLLVTTFCYCAPEDVDQFNAFESTVLRHGGALLPVFLRCSERESMRRVGNRDRAARRKIASQERLRSFIEENNIAPVPRADCLQLDTSVTSADATAQTIIRHFGLQPASV